ncbi:hypothetical protein [Clostridium porci]|nr:hypothetical protein [Clostridium porci]
MRKKYNTPHRSWVIKTRMTDEEYAEFAALKFEVLQKVGEAIGDTQTYQL